MAQCRIDLSHFHRALAELKRKHRLSEVDEDLNDLFKHIVQAPTKAAGARRYELGNEDYEVYTYDCKSTDMKKGAKNAFRLVAAYDKKTNVVTPLTIYYKGDLAHMPANEVLRAVAAIRAATEPEPPSSQSPSAS